MAQSPILALKDSEISWLNQHFQHYSAEKMIAEIIQNQLLGKLVLVSSFGADSIVLLHKISEIDSNLPIFFINTGKLFIETEEYHEYVIERLALSNVTSLHPHQDRVAKEDQGNLHRQNPDLCCHLRKTLPLESGLKGYDSWMTGRRRDQSLSRQELPLFERDQDNRIKVNPMAIWTREEVEAYISLHNLPRHPLVATGYPSIGCAPCTNKINAGDPIRSGRWQGLDKVECGIHLVNGKFTASAHQNVSNQN